MEKTDDGSYQAYNIQIAVENYFIVHAYASNDRTDYNTLIPVLEKHKNAFGEIWEEVTADSGYCSEKNLLYLKKNKISSYIKLQDHEKRKTRANSENIGKYYNIKTQMFEDELYDVCHDGRELHHIRTENKEQADYTQTLEVYGCADCSGCDHKAKCLYKYNAEKDAEKNKVMKINEQWERLKEESHANIQSEKELLRKSVCPKMQFRGFCTLKYIKKRKTRISRKRSGTKNTDFYGRFLFSDLEAKKRY